jgi:DNA processing protein
VDEKVYEIALAHFNKLSITRIKEILARVGGPRPFFEKSIRELAEILCVSEKKISHYNREAAIDRAVIEIDFMEKNDIQYHYYKSDNYPAALKFCEDSPLILFSKGDIDFNLRNLAIVGTRKATAYGRRFTSKFVQDINTQPLQIISGLAHGIDRIAHESAIKEGLPTIAVLGHGLDFIYPAAHRGLAKEMLKNGGLITEFMSQTPGEPSNFPRRNRIVAGMSEATIVVESGIKGGSFITANMANSYNREVFAVPGSVYDAYSSGCNQLIRQNKAHLLQGVEDFLEVMDWKADSKEEQIAQTNIFDALTQDEEKLYRLLRSNNEPLHIDRLGHDSGLAPRDVALTIFNLEMRGSVQALPGKYYCIIN